ncbi:protein kinase family protein [Blastococcus sp. URHD0036]|uniref:protein kinase family protein n=1 Tax=Blastococcus sp. URHD0036 TaxID=1380356 RepID=UPI000497DED1|nr:protein kinase family protein [Blastococcus sp. URHD0036]
MTSTVTGLPDRYRPLDEIGPEETTSTGVIRCWRAKDRVLNRDVAIRVHTPGGPAARAWIARALTSGGLATPALAMVYDAAEGTGAVDVPGGAAYVVNEWIEGRTLTERLADGPMPEREVRTVLRRLAEGVAEAHRVGLAVGGIGPDTVVLRPNGLVGLRAVPAASGTMQGDIAALGALLEFCLTGRQAGRPGPDGRPPRPVVIPQPDLAALIRRARSADPAGGLSSAAAMAALLAQPPRPSSSGHIVRDPDESDSGWLRRLRERHEADDYDAEDYSAEYDDEDDDRYDPEDDPQRTGLTVLPPGPPHHGSSRLPLDDAFGADEDLLPDDRGRSDEDDERPARRRLVVVALALVALAVVVAGAWWFGTYVLSVADSDDGAGAGPSGPSSSSAPQETTGGETPAPEDTPAAITRATLYNPQDSDPENEGDVPLAFDGDPGTAWSTVDYQGSADFAGLKDGVGIVFDLGGDQALAAVTITTNTPGVTMEARIGGAPDADLAQWQVAASGTIDGTTDLAFDEPVTTRYLLVWVTSLAPGPDGFSADIAEVSVRSAG